MKFASKMMFGKLRGIVGKDIKRQVHELDRHPKERVMFLQPIARPRFVTQTDGKTVEYTGP